MASTPAATGALRQCSSSRLQKLAIATGLLSCLVTVGVPLMQFFLVFSMHLQLAGHVLITTGSCALVAGVLGLAGAIWRGSALLSLHVMVALLLAALMGAFNTQVYLDLNSRCSMSQAAFAGCASCTCAATSTCTAANLAASGRGCSGCRAPAADMCLRVRWMALLLPFTGLIEAVFLALPGVMSMLLLSSSPRCAGCHGPQVAADGAAGDGDIRVAIKSPRKHHDHSHNNHTHQQALEHEAAPLAWQQQGAEMMAGGEYGVPPLGEGGASGGYLCGSADEGGHMVPVPPPGPAPPPRTKSHKKSSKGVTHSTGIRAEGVGH